MSDNHFLSAAQHGYRRFHSCETALHLVTDSILAAIDRGEVALLAMIDLSKAFDVVPHLKLLQKLALYGIDTNWFSNYLAGHTQQVQIRSPSGELTTSQTKPNEIGVYQGGSLSCTLFSIYTNDMSLYVPETVQLVTFADDTQLIKFGKKSDLPAIVAEMESVLKTLFNWCSQNFLKVNTGKTQLMLLGSPPILRSLKDPLTLNFCGSNVTACQLVKSLGLWIDPALKFETHVDRVVARCTGQLVALNQTRHVLPPSTIVSIVQALVMSSLRYCISIYGTCTKTQIHRIQKLINFCARVVSGRRRYDHISDVIGELGWLRADELVAYHRMLTVYRAVHCGVPEQLAITIGPTADQRHEHYTRAAQRITLPRIRTEAGRRRICYSAVDAYNGLQHPLTDHGHKRQIKRHVIAQRSEQQATRVA